MISKCPYCSKKYVFKDEYEYDKTICEECGEEFVIKRKIPSYTLANFFTFVGIVGIPGGVFLCGVEPVAGAAAISSSLLTLLFAQIIHRLTGILIALRNK